MPTESKEKAKALQERLADIQLELKAPKNQFNEFGKYNYRSCEDILEGVKPLLNGLVLTLCDEIVQLGDRFYIKAVADLTDGKEHFIVTAFARESEAKAGMDSAQITGSASSYARKYALNGLFLIDDTKDADTQDNTTKAPAVAIAPDSSRPAAFRRSPARIHMVTAEKAEKSKQESNPLPLQVCEVCGAEITERIAKYSKDQFGKVLCMKDQMIERKKQGGTK